MTPIFNLLPRTVCLAGLFLLSAAGPASAGALYKCVDDARHTTYTTSKTSGSCVVLSQSSSGSSSSTSSASAVPRAKAPATPSPADFPRVSGDAQKSRDSDRKRILEQELASEQRNYDEAKRSVAEQEQAKLPAERLQPLKDRLALHERNLVALKKEIGNLR